MTDKIVMADSPEAATRVTLTGWVSRDGIFYGNDERIARFAGCTHVACQDCGAPVEKLWLACAPCRDLRDKARYEALPTAPWDGTCMLYSGVRDQYYNEPSDAQDALEEGQTLADLRLVLCMPNRAPELTEDYFEDVLPDEGDVPPQLQAAMDAFNAALKDAAVLSWSPGRVALALEP